MFIYGRQVGKICDLQHSSGHIAMQNCIHSRPAEQMKTRWFAPFQITHWHAPRMCTAWGCSLTVNLGPHGLLNVKTGAGTRDFSDSHTVLQTLTSTMGASQCNPVLACFYPPMHAHGNHGSWLMLGQSQMHPGCSKTTQEPSKCMQIAPNVVTLFTIGKV